MKKLLFLIAIFIIFVQIPAQYKPWTNSKQPLKEIKALKKQIKKPKFRKSDYLITNFEAIGDGKTKNTEAFKKAIEKCNAEGGGRVIVPDGVFLTGAIYLKSNVNLHLSDIATILFCTESKDCPIVFTRWEGMECMNYSSLIYAYEEENIAITGKGTLDGNSDNDHWWFWCGATKYGYNESRPGRQNPARAKLHEYMANRTPARERIFGDGYYLT